MSNEINREFFDDRFYDKLNDEYVDQWQLDDEEDDDVKRDLYKTESRKIPVIDIEDIIYDRLSDVFENADDVIQNKQKEIEELRSFLKSWWVKNIPEYVCKTNVKAEL